MAFSRALFGLAAVPLIAILAGCARNSDVVGAWKADLAFDQPAKDSGEQIGRGIVNSFFNAATVEFKPDHTFTAHIVADVTGTWSISGNVVTAVFDKSANGKANVETDQPLKLDLSTDGKTLVVENQNDGENKDSSSRLVLRRTDKQ